MCIRDSFAVETKQLSVMLLISVIKYLIVVPDVKDFAQAAPVSYTHLDVYKRQAIPCTGRVLNPSPPNTFSAWFPKSVPTW